MCSGRITLLLLMACGMTESWWWWGSYEPWAFHDRVGLATKYLMLNITHELVEDAYLQLRHVAAIKDYHSYKIEYQVGYIMGQIREKYRRMMEHYYQWRDKASGKSVFIGPGVRELSGIFWLMSMEQVAMIEMDIRKYIESVLVYYHTEELPMYERKSKRREREKSSKKRAARMRQEEKDLKKRFRAQFLARRLGLPDNYTTKSKRFQDKWPVEDTWDNFGPYDIGL